MALGGGVFTTQNKVLPGSYINMVSASRASSEISERGIAAMPLLLDWGEDGKVFTVTSEQFQKDTQKIFGYSYTHEKMKGLRDLFLNIKQGMFYKLGTSKAATCDYAAARFGGIRGNDFKVAIAKNVDDDEKFDVTLFLDGAKVDMQTVTKAADLADNDYVIWKKDATLAVAAAAPLTGGTSAESATGEDYQAFIVAIEPYSFNTLGCLSTEDTVKNLFAQFTKRMRDECGVKFQTVLYQPQSPDYEGVIGVENKTLDVSFPESAAVYWVTGAEAGCSVNRSCTNKRYDGELAIETKHTQAQLVDGIKEGKLLFHKVGDAVRVLEDINTFTSFVDGKGEDFASNQTMRVVDQIANDIAALFHTKYLGQIPNDAAGRVSLWSDIVSHHKELEVLRAIEGFASESVVVSAGESKKAVVVSDSVMPTNAMAQLYMTLMIS